MRRERRPAAYGGMVGRALWVSGASEHIGVGFVEARIIAPPRPASVTNGKNIPVAYAGTSASHTRSLRFHITAAYGVADGRRVI